ncbi:MAG: acylphosphatase, partial [Acidobacteria bacterium]
MKVARKFIISGVVQGVGYRFFTQRAAAENQIFGYVRNLKNGDVEVVAEGEPQQMEDFKRKL